MSRVLVGAGLVSAGSIASHLVNFYAISTATVTSGGNGSFSFTSIPQTFTHLQLRIFGRESGTYTYGGSVQIMFNTDASGNSNYSGHGMYGNGSSTLNWGNGISTDRAYINRLSCDTQSSGIYGALIIDILNYKNTNVYKTIKYIGGFDANGSSNGGTISFGSDAWLKTDAINAMTFYYDTGAWEIGTQFALYGIK